MSAGAGFGIGAIGTMPFGTGDEPSTFYVVGASARTLNSVSVQFSLPPRVVDPVLVSDALLPSGWSLQAVTPGAVVRLPQFVEETSDPDVLVVYFDGELTSEARYVISTSSELRSASDALLVDPSNHSASFNALRVPRTVRQVQQRSDMIDLANPQQSKYARDPAQSLGTLQATQAGRLELDNGVRRVAKQVLRAATTKPGGFLHMPGYGALPAGKTLIRTSDLRKMQQDLRQQILKIAGVVGADVGVQQDPSAPVVYCSISVKTQNGTSADVSFAYDLTTGGFQ